MVSRSGHGRKRRRHLRALAAARREGTRPSKAGAVGICSNCGRQVLPRFVRDETHTATVTYGRNRIPCGGRVIPLWPGSLEGRKGP